MPGACSLPVIGVACSIGSSAASSVAGDFIQTAASDAANAADSLLKTLATAWTQIPTPTGANCGSGPNGSYGCQQASGGNAGAIAFIQGDLKFVTLFVGVAAILAAAGRMAYMQRGEPLREAAHGLLRLVVVSGAGLAFISILAQAGDSFSSYVLSSTPSSKSGDLAQATSLFKLSGGGANFSSVSFLLLILAILAILATLVQLFLIIVRSALLVVMAGVWPVSAAASMTGGGQSMFKKTTGYILAFLLYKPAAAIVYALAFYLIQNPPANGDPLVTQIEGVVLIVLATLTLPALLKFVVPAVASAGGVGAGELIGTGVSLATGAAALVATGGAAAAGGAGAAGASGGSATAATASKGQTGPPGASPPTSEGGNNGQSPGGNNGDGAKKTTEIATELVPENDGSAIKTGASGAQNGSGGGSPPGGGSGPSGSGGQTNSGQGDGGVWAPPAQGPSTGSTKPEGKEE